MARQWRPMPRRRRTILQRGIFLAVLVAGIVAAFAFRRFLTVPQIQGFVVRLGHWGPIVFVLACSVGPAFLVPGLPLALAAGLLFAPVSAPVYSLVGAT